MKHGAPLVSLEDLIKAALNHTPYNQQRLGKEAQRYADRISRAKAPDLPGDLHADVFSEAFAQLFRVGAAGLARHDGKALFRRAVLKAIRKVRADYAPPGQQTRAQVGGHRDDRVAAHDAIRIVDRETLGKISVENGVAQPPDFDRLPDPVGLGAYEVVDNARDVHTLLKLASADVVAALRSIHFDETPVQDVAAEMGVDRFTLNRRLTAFFLTCRMAA